MVFRNRFPKYRLCSVGLEGKKVRFATSFFFRSSSFIDILIGRGERKNIRFAVSRTQGYLPFAVYRIYFVVVVGRKSLHVHHVSVGLKNKGSERRSATVLSPQRLYSWNFSFLYFRTFPSAKHVYIIVVINVWRVRSTGVNGYGTKRVYVYEIKNEKTLFTSRHSYLLLLYVCDTSVRRKSTRMDTIVEETLTPRIVLLLSPPSGDPAGWGIADQVDMLILIAANTKSEEW